MSLLTVLQPASLINKMKQYSVRDATAGVFIAENSGNHYRYLSGVRTTANHFEMVVIH